MLSRRILQQITSAYEQKIPEKHDLIASHMDFFVKNRFDEANFQVIISGVQIADVVLNYFVDVLRFKERRDMENEEDYITSGKVAAFTCKWLIKLRPMTVEPCAEISKLSNQQVGRSRYANELFAIEHAQRIIGIDFSLQLKNELLHEFRQKKFSETQLYMTFEQAMGYYDHSKHSR